MSTVVMPAKSSFNSSAMAFVNSLFMSTLLEMPSTAPSDEYCHRIAAPDTLGAFTEYLATHLS